MRTTFENVLQLYTDVNVRRSIDLPAFLYMPERYRSSVRLNEAGRTVEIKPK